MKKNRVLKTVAFSLVGIILLLSGFILGYVANKTESKKEITSCKNNIFLLQEKIEKLKKELSKSNEEKEIKVVNSEIIDYLQSTKQKKQTTQPLSTHPHKSIQKNKKPKLVIIIDDVAFKYQVSLIKQIPFHITPSFFPPNKIHPKTYIYAKEFKSYMVHVPMQAFHFQKPEPNTLEINNSLKSIENRISLIKEEFPNAHFINNHTGSKFTSNYEAMKKLFKALKENNLGFVDSKTTHLIQSYNVNKIYHIPLFSRNIFLDNKEDKKYILNQLKKAIEIAKKRGYAIAIGHPHKITLETLKNAKNLLTQVDVIYIDELAKYAKN